MKKYIPILLSFMVAKEATGQETKKWNIEKAPGPRKTVSFTTDEGTWMDLDISPDGKEIVFDLLGDIYKMPVSGGKATLLAGGMAFEVQPRFSPNGKYISFTSDKDGGNNIWIMNADGSNKRAVTKENFRLLNNAVWTPDNQYIIARKHFTGTRSLGAGEMWMYHISGGDGIQLTKRKNDQQDAGEPEVSPDGKYLYFSEDVTPGPFFQYNKDPNGEIYNIKRLNRTTGEIETVTGGQGGAARPQLSPDGRYLAFVKRVRLKSTLFLHDLETGEEWPVYDDLSRDQQEAWAIFGVYSNFDWTPDSKSIVFYAKGKIRKLDIASLNTTEIPFEADVKQTITEALHFNQPVFEDEFEVKMIRQLTTSPDNKKIAFNAAGYIYIKDLPNGKVERVSDGSDFEFEPDFSPDGKSLVYVSWSDEGRGSVNKIDLRSGRITRLTTEKGYYYSPKFSNKGDKVVFRKGSGNDVLGYTYSKNTGIYVVAANGGKASLISRSGLRPTFNADDSRIFFQSTEGGKKAFKSMDLNGGSVRTHYTSTYANLFVPSPDGKYLAFTELFNAYVTPLVTTGNALELSSTNKALPLTRITRDAGSYLHWSQDGKQLHWTLGPQYFTRDLKTAFTFLDGSPDKLPAIDSTGLDIGFKLKSDLPTGKIAFTGARIITMKGDQVIENGTIIVDKNRITAVGKSSEVNIPADAKVVNADGKTIMPGLIDV
ncbi:MAG TPA: amidohydrolase, partial [Sphingobacteriaceae bacterium]